MHDVLVLLVALLATLFPGLALLAALRVKNLVLLVALAPAASVGVAGATAVVTSLVGLAYGPIALGVVTVVLGSVAIASHAWLGAPTPTVRSRRAVTKLISAVGIGMVVTGSALGSVTWWRSLGRTLSTIPQEHDMIIHVMLTAYIQRTGRAAPWQLVPADVLTGEPVAFYPSGLHLLASVPAEISGSTVDGINATTVVLLGVVLSTSTAALAAVAARQLRLAPTSVMLVAGVASLIAAGLYRPTFQLMHDGGILASAAAFAIAPGVIAALVQLPYLPRRVALAVGVACAGVTWVHPSAAISVGLTVLAWWAGQALAPVGRRQLRTLLVPLSVCLASALTLLIANIVPALGTLGNTSGFPPDSEPTSLRAALGSTLGLTYAGFFDQAQSRAHAVAAVLMLIGVASILLLRRGYGPVTAWATWTVVTTGAFLTPGSGPDALITGFFYNALPRVWSHISLLAPVLGGLGLVQTTSLTAVWLRRHLALPALPTASILGVLAWTAYFLGPALDYADTNVTALSTRYSTPAFIRVDRDDERAIDWLAKRVEPGQRVMNSPNDGSTYLYIKRGIPVVNVYTLGLYGVPYSYRLLESFNTYPFNERIRDRLIRLNVAWVYVDSQAPRIGSKGEPNGWAGDDGFRLAPGLMDLSGLPGLTNEFSSGSVTVYSVDLDVLRSL